MRLTHEQANAIRAIVTQEAGPEAQIRVFGSRAQDSLKGGDLDLFVELPTGVEHPAQLSARISARVSRCMHGRRVDVLLGAPNLQRLPIHNRAEREGVPL